MRKTMPYTNSQRNTINRGAIQYELTNHLGNVLAVVTGKKLRDADYNYLPDLVSTQDYSPFGMQLEGRSWNSKEYRFGFQGQQKDDEIYNEGNAYSAQFWEYDARLSRRWNIDPLPKPYESLYATFANNPTSNVDPDGRDSIVFRRWMANGEVITTTNYCVDNGPKLYYVAYDEIYNQSLREEMIPMEKVGSPSTKTSDATPSEKESSHMPYFGLDRLNVTLRGTSETENTWADKYLGKPLGTFGADVLLSPLIAGKAIFSDEDFLTKEKISTGERVFNVVSAMPGFKPFSRLAKTGKLGVKFDGELTDELIEKGFNTIDLLKQYKDAIDEN